MLLAFELAPFLGEVAAPFRQLGQGDRASLVGVQQTLVGPRGSVQPGVEVLLGCLVPNGTRLGRGGEVVELGQQSVGVGEQAGDMIPHGTFDLLGLDVAARAGRRAGGQDAILAVALVIAPLSLAHRRGVGAAEHGQAAARAGQQAAQEIAVLGIVPERERGIAGELHLRPAPGPGVNDRRHGNGDPLLARLEPAARGLAGTWPATMAGSLGRDEAVSIGVGRTSVDRVGQDVVHHRRRPGVMAGAREVGAGVQALEDLSDGHLLVDEPAVEGAHHLGLALVHHEVTGHGVLARHVAVAVGGTAALVVAIACPLQLAAAEALAEDGALVFSDGTLDLQQKLIVGVVRDRVLQERHLDARAVELLQQQDLIGVSARQPVGGQHGDDPDGAVVHGVAQRVEAGPVEPAAAVALVTEDVLVGHDMAARGRPGAQGGKLAVDGLIAFLALGGHAGVEGGAHGGHTSGCGVEGGVVSSSRRR